MKLIFLDFDAVLNSYRYDKQRGCNDGNIDETRMPILFRIVAQTGGADIVLSTSWRKHWSADPNEIDFIGKEIEALFQKYGLKILDKTPVSENNDRAQEIRMWLTDHPYVENFVILDDIRFGWGDLQPHVINTNYRIGRGLEESHMEAAIKLLNSSDPNHA